MPTELVSWEDVVSRKRDYRTALARHQVMYDLYMQGLTYQAIGELLGGRSPATVQHGFMRIAKMKERKMKRKPPRRLRRNS